MPEPVSPNVGQTPKSLAAPEFLDLPKIIPQGGSKWAALYAKPQHLALAAPPLQFLEQTAIHPDGYVLPPSPGLQEFAGHAIAVEAGPQVSLGKFLTGSLNLALLADVAESPALCGRAASPRQNEVLAKLGWLQHYRALQDPVCFNTVICAAAPLNPGMHLRALAARLRVKKSTGHGRIAILPVHETEKFSLANRASLAAWLRAKQIYLVAPEAMEFDDLAKTMADAGLVVLADPTQAGLLGLCHPGTKIIEITPEGWLDPQMQLLSVIFGLSYTAFFANAPSYKLLSPLPFGARVPLSYEVSIRDLAGTLAAI